jgi:ribosomal protein L37AE/L43A
VTHEETTAPADDGTPAKLRPYLAHGLVFTTKIVTEKGAEHVADYCPFCGKERKFYVSEAEGKWQCKSCNSGSDKGGGNEYTFLRLLHEASSATEPEYEQLAHDRGVLSTSSFTEWGVRRHALTGEWCIPGYNAKGGLIELYRQVTLPGQKPRFLATSGMRHGIHGPGNGTLASAVSRADSVYVAEGPWDGICLSEALRRGKPGDNGGVVPTGSPEISLGRNTVVLAAPGAGVFREDWADALGGKDVVLCYDSDHPRKLKTGKESRVGWDAMKRLTGVLASRETPPKTVRVVRWGPDGYDPQRKDGWDVRDHLAAGGEGLRPRLTQLGDLLGKIQPVPAEWIPGRAREAV